MWNTLKPLMPGVLLNGVCFKCITENNSDFTDKFTKYLKGSCWLESALHFSFKYFQKIAKFLQILP